MLCASKFVVYVNQIIMFIISKVFVDILSCDKVGVVVDTIRNTLAFIVKGDNLKSNIREF